MKIINKITIVFSIATCLISCSDYVDQDALEISKIDSTTYLNNEEDFSAALNGVYDPIQWLHMSSLIGDIASDNSVSGGESAVDIIGLQEIDDMTHYASNDVLSDIMTFCYEGINRANYLDDNKGKLNFDGKDVLFGEVYFLRAYYYFELAKFFGNVTVFTERLDASFSGNLSQNSQDEVYAQIESDLNQAISSLPIEQGVDGKATLGAAQALLGKVYLYQKKYDQAATILSNLIGEYTLVDDFRSQFLNSGENGPESIFEIQYTNQSNWYDWGFMPEGTEGNFGVQHQGPRGFVGDTYASGWSFNLPTQDLYDAYEDGDSRREATILDPIAIGASYTPAWKDTGYFNHKYVPIAGESGAQIELNYGNNYRAIRYSDVLLMASEAYNNSTTRNIVLALDYLNQVRRRAFGDLSHDITETNQVNLNEIIWEERRLELAMEGHRFFDLVRTEKAEDVLADHGYKFHNRFFPIPQIELDLSGWEQVDNEDDQEGY